MILAKVFNTEPTEVIEYTEALCVILFSSVISVLKKASLCLTFQRKCSRE
jgi:hypothetical protein